MGVFFITANGRERKAGMLPMRVSCYPAGQYIHDARIGCVPGREIMWVKEPRETSGPVMLTVECPT